MNELTVRPDRFARLRAICLGLPSAVEKIAWGDPTWRVRDRIFAMQKGNYAGGRPSIWLKAEDGQQAALVEMDPALFFVPPYVGSKGWVGVYLDGKKIDWGMIAALVEASHRLIAGSGGRRRGTPRRSVSKKKDRAR
jgi:predicted DNA-binding protein (MmcQ/YjbR family)